MTIGTRSYSRILSASIVAALLVACGPRRVRPIPVGPKLDVNASVKIRVNAWTKLSSATQGKTVESKQAQDIPVLIRRIFDEGIPAGPVDVVFVVDSTGSMGDDIKAVKQDIRQILNHLRERNPDYQIGVVVYRDIHDAYLTKTLLSLSRDDYYIQRAINNMQVHGGDDWPEHVYAGITTALNGQPWRPNASQNIILMGDAPPHEDYTNDPRTYESVTSRAQTPPLNVKIHTIGIKCDRTCRKALAKEARQARRQRQNKPTWP